MNDSDIQAAAGRIRIALQRLAGRYIFHVNLLERLVVRASIKINTMAVSTSGDDVLLLYRPEFVQSITLDQLGGVLLHETHHVLFGHLLANPVDYPDEWARTVAEEVTVNEFVMEPLPGAPILLKQFPVLHPMESTHDRYLRLARTAKNKRPAIEPPALPVQGDNAGGKQGAASCPSALATVDDHGVWNEALKDNPTAAEAAVRALIQDTALAVGESNIPEHLKSIVGSAGIGTTAGNEEVQLHPGGRGQLDWIRLLRRYVGHLVQIRPDFQRPPRRFPQWVGVIPGRRRVGARPNILAVIDTSASMTDELLQQISDELARMARDYAVTVAECDTTIQAVYAHRPIERVSGRGGTDLRPPFEKSFLRRYKPDLIIYFTDGQGPAPQRSPRMPVVWCLTPGGVSPAKWGRVIEMADVPTSNVG